MNKGKRNIIIFYFIIFALILFFEGICIAQVIISGVPPLPINVTYIPDPLLTFGSLPPIYPYVGDTITAFDSFVWPTGAVVPSTSLADISFAVPGTFSGFPGLSDPQIYLSTSFPTYVDYMNLYFTAAPDGSTLPGAFSPFGLPSVTAYTGYLTIYPYYSYGDISTLLAFYAINPIASSYISGYPLII
ncbi:MAG: hypothetical protein ACMUJM_17605 [bacterium]